MTDLPDRVPMRFLQEIDVRMFRSHYGAARKSEETDESCEADRLLLDALGLYRADFLSGFTLPDCQVFDEWQRLQSDAL